MYNELLRKKESVLCLRRGVVQDLQKWNGRRTILKDGLVVDPENERKDQFDIVVEGDTISSVEKNVYIEKGDRILECEGLQIWPGLIDSHLHLGDLFDVSTNSIVCAVQDGVTAGISPGAGNSFMAPALLGAEIDRGLPLNAGVYLGAANILGTSMNEEEMIDLFQGKAAKELLEQKLSRNVFTNQMAPFIIGIKDHMGHFIMKDEDIDKIFDITQKANLIYMSHTQDPEHSWRMYELSKGRKLHLGHANAAGTGSHGNAEEAMQSVIELCKKKNITAEFVTTMLRKNGGSREGLRMSEKARETALNALSEGIVKILVSDGQHQSTMKGFGDTSDNIPCILELVENGVLSLEKAVATMTCNTAQYLSEKLKCSVWKKMGHLGKGAFANITIVDPKNARAVYVIVNGQIVVFEGRILRSFGHAGRWISKFGISEKTGVGDSSLQIIR